MPKLLVNYVRYVDAMNNRLGRGLKYGVLVLVGILVIEGVSRYIFNRPTAWSIELAEFTLGAYFLLAGGYCLLHDRHVRMDALYNRLSLKTQAILEAVTFSLLAIYLGVWLLGGYYNIRFAFEMNQHYASTWGPHLGPIKIIIEVGAFLLLLQGVAILIRNVSFIRGKPIT